MPQYFTVIDLLKNYSIEDNDILVKAENHSLTFNLTETFQILLEKNIKDTDIICTILDLNDNDYMNLKNIVKILNEKQILNESILNKILIFTPIEKLFNACAQLEKLELLTTETLDKIMTEDIDNRVSELTKPFPIKNTYLYLKATYGSTIKWSLGCGLGLGGTYYLIASFKLLAINILNSHPLIGAAIIASSILILFILSKTFSEYFPQKIPNF